VLRQILDADVGSGNTGEVGQHFLLQRRDSSLLQNEKR
jgi:hypothetical protein